MMQAWEHTLEIAKEQAYIKGIEAERKQSEDLIKSLEQHIKELEQQLIALETKRQDEHSYYENVLSELEQQLEPKSCSSCIALRKCEIYKLWGNENFYCADYEPKDG